MHRRIGMAVLAAALAAAPAASAFTMGETVAATGVQGTLARTNTLNVKGTLDSVKNAVGSASREHNAKLEQAQVSWGSRSGQSRWAGGGNATGKGWAAGAGGWNSNGRSGGSTGWQVTSGGSKSWATGTWGSAHN